MRRRKYLTKFRLHLPVNSHHACMISLLPITSAKEKLAKQWQSIRNILIAQSHVLQIHAELLHLGIPTIPTEDTHRFNHLSPLRQRTIIKVVCSISRALFHICGQPINIRHCMTFFKLNWMPLKVETKSILRWQSVTVIGGKINAINRSRFLQICKRNFRRISL